MKCIKFLIASTLLIATGNLLAAVDPQPGQSLWTILKNIGIVSDCRTPIAIPDPQGSTYTISSADNYQLIENSTGRIIVDANDVCLNLNCFSLTHTNADEHVISVSSNKKNIRIHNGKIGTTTLGSGCGILVNYGCSFVTIDNMRITDCGNGIKLDGQNGSEVKSCTVMECDFVGNTTGLVLYHSNRNIVENCCCLDNLQAGYELLHSEVNCITECKAINTTSADSTAVAFTSRDGRSNMFKNCTAKNTETDAWEFCNKAYGFLLTGTEEKTKIIDCLVNETDVTSTVSAIAYGIHLDPILLGVDDLLNEIDDDSSSLDTFARSVAWSPDSKYIATGDNSNVRVFGFDGSALNLIDSNSTPGSFISSVAWSSNGKYIVSGDFGNYVRVFSFDGSTLTHIDGDNTPAAVLRSVAWSPNGKYIASGDFGNYVRVFSFDGSTLTYIDGDNTPGNDVWTVGWSPDGKYIVTGDFGNYVRIFGFDGSSLNLIDSNNSPGTLVRSVAWSPNGTYIASGDQANFVRVFSFDGTSLILTDSDDKPGARVNSVAWSPNGKYITSGDDSEYVRVFSFDGSTLTYIDGNNAPGQDVLSIAWSPDGKYIASGDEGPSLRTFDAMFGPESCLIKGNCVCDTAAFGQFVGTGIAGSIANNNGIIFNACHNNEVNYSYGIPNVYDLLTTSSIDLTDNLSCGC